MKKQRIKYNKVITLTILFILVYTIPVLAGDGPNIAETFFIEIIRELADMTNDALATVGLTLDQMIFGAEINGVTSPLHFDLAWDNPFAYVAVHLYPLFRGLALIAMFSIGSAAGIRIMLISNNSRSKADAKSIIGTFIISTLLLFEMPYLIEVLLIIRDGVMDSILSAANALLGSNASLMGETLKNAAYAENARLFDALIYLGAVLVSFWFAFVYASLGMSMGALFATFPIASTTLNGASTKSIFDNWLKEFFSYLSIPLIDALILIIPFFAWISGKVAELIVVLMIAMVIPTRTLLRRIFGIGGSMGEMAGIGFLMSAGALAGSAVRAAKGVGGGVAGAIGDYKDSRTFEQMGNLDGGFGMNPVMVGGSAGAGFGMQSLSNVDYSEYMSSPSSTVSGENTHGTGLALARGTSIQPASDISGYSSGFNSIQSSNDYGETDSDSSQSLEDYQSKRQQIIAKNAKTSWLDDPNLAKNLTDKDRARLLRKRAGQQAFKAIGTGAGSIAGLGVGGTLGAWYGQAGLLTGAGAGMNAGSALGGGIAEGSFNLAHSGISKGVGLLNMDSQRAIIEAAINYDLSSYKEEIPYLATHPVQASNSEDDIIDGEGTVVPETNGSIPILNSDFQESQGENEYSMPATASNNPNVNINIPPASLGDLNIEHPEVQQIMNRVVSNPEVVKGSNVAGMQAREQFFSKMRNDFLNKEMEDYRSTYNTEVPDDIRLVLEEMADDYIGQDHIQLDGASVYTNEVLNYRASEVMKEVEKQFSDPATRENLNTQIQSNMERLYTSMAHELEKSFNTYSHVNTENADGTDRDVWDIIDDIVDRGDRDAI